MYRWEDRVHPEGIQIHPESHARTHTESWQSLQGPHSQPRCLPTHHWLWVKNPTSSSKRQEEQGVRRTTYTGLGRGQWLPPHQLQCHAEIFKENLHVHVSVRTEACVHVCGNYYRLLILKLTFKESLLLRKSPLNAYKGRRPHGSFQLKSHTKQKIPKQLSIL